MVLSKCKMRCTTANGFSIAFKSGKKSVLLYCYVLFGHSDSSWFGFSVAELNVGQGRFVTTSQPNRRLGVQWLNLFLLAVSLHLRTNLEGLEGFVPIRYHSGGRPQNQNCVFFTLPWKGAEWNPRVVKVLQFNEDRNPVGSSRFWHTNLFLHCKIADFATTRWHEQGSFFESDLGNRHQNSECLGALAWVMFSWISLYYTENKQLEVRSHKALAF